jgi:hypothetical protein
MIPRRAAMRRPERLTADCDEVEPLHHEHSSVRTGDLLGKKHDSRCDWVNDSATRYSGGLLKQDEGA